MGFSDVERRVFAFPARKRQNAHSKGCFLWVFLGGGPGMSEAGLNMLLGSTVKQPASYV